MCDEALLLLLLRPLHGGLPILPAWAAGQLLLLLLLVQPTAGLAAAAAAAADNAAAAAAAATLHSLTMKRSRAGLMSIAARRHAIPILTLPFSAA
jgi:hypothetical protein